MGIVIEKSYVICDGCGQPAKKKIISETNRKEINVCGGCFVGLANRLKHLFKEL